MAKGKQNEAFKYRLKPAKKHPFLRPICMYVTYSLVRFEGLLYENRNAYEVSGWIAGFQNLNTNTRRHSCPQTRAGNRKELPNPEPP